MQPRERPPEGTTCADCGAPFTDSDWLRWRRDENDEFYCGICARSRGLRT